MELRRPEDDLVFELPRDGRDGFLVPWRLEIDLVESGSSPDFQGNGQGWKRETVLKEGIWPMEKRLSDSFTERVS